jgi:hypothetical protein
MKSCPRSLIQSSKFRPELSQADLMPFAYYVNCSLSNPLETAISDFIHAWISSSPPPTLKLTRTSLFCCRVVTAYTLRLSRRHRGPPALGPLAASSGGQPAQRHRTEGSSKQSLLRCAFTGSELASSEATLGLVGTPLWLHFWDQRRGVRHSHLLLLSQYNC